MGTQFWDSRYNGLVKQYFSVTVGGQFFDQFCMTAFKNGPFNQTEKIRLYFVFKCVYCVLNLILANPLIFCGLSHVTTYYLS